MAQVTILNLNTEEGLVCLVVKLDMPTLVDIWDPFQAPSAQYGARKKAYDTCERHVSYGLLHHLPAQLEACWASTFTNEPSDGDLG